MAQVGDAESEIVDTHEFGIVVDGLKDGRVRVSSYVDAKVNAVVVEDWPTARQLIAVLTSAWRV